MPPPPRNDPHATPLRHVSLLAHLIPDVQNHRSRHLASLTVDDFSPFFPIHFFVLVLGMETTSSSYAVRAIFLCRKYGGPESPVRHFPLFVIRLTVPLISNGRTIFLARRHFRPGYRRFHWRDRFFVFGLKFSETFSIFEDLPPGRASLMIVRSFLFAPSYHPPPSFLFSYLPECFTNPDMYL